MSDDLEKIEHVEKEHVGQEGELKRGLKNRHAQMIS